MLHLPQKVLRFTPRTLPRLCAAQRHDFVKKYFLNTYQFGRKDYGESGEPSKVSAFVNSAWDKLTHIQKNYEEFIGLRQVREAQNGVIKAEEEFLLHQRNRRDAQQKVSDLQITLKELREEAERYPRGHERHLDVVKREHDALQKERSLLAALEDCEKLERDTFATLSYRLRTSHEREREQAERTKYWSLIATVAGALIGALATTITARVRLKEIKDTIYEASTSSTASMDDTILQRLEEIVNRPIAMDKPMTVPLPQAISYSDEPIIDIKQLIEKRNRETQTLIVGCSLALLLGVPVAIVLSTFGR